MSKKIMTRLIRNYTLLLMLFSLVILFVFFSLLNRQATDIHKEQLIEQGDIIAKNIMEDELVSKETDDDMGSHSRRMRNRNHMMTSNSYLNLISSLSTDEIFIVDTKGDSLISGHMMDEEPKELDDDGRAILNVVLKSQEPTYLDQEIKQKGYGVPLFDNEGTIYGSVIAISTKENTVTQSLKDYRILIWSILIALLIAIIISIYLARSFVKPIYQMADFTEMLIQNDYQQDLDIKTKDELAALGSKLLILSDRLAIAQKEQENKEKSQKLFLSQISHELRTPVMVIKNSLEILGDNFLNENERQDYIKQLLKETDQLNVLVNDLLELSHLQSTEFSIKKEELHLKDVLDDSVRSLRQQMGDSNKIIVVNHLNSADIYQGDYQRLLQLVRILLDNALKYSPENEKVNCSLIRTKKGYELEIKNTSLEQIEEEESARFFEAFNRGQFNQVEGHGLGLTIAKQIVARHQGTINFKVVNSKEVQVQIILTD
ncbi:sensor histidine kinase [Vagococcus hydrophili]|uniref:histidine kinase n=1 Tax=Vagococcus hydrophili TaxID=2714947 RepID=A0A6G8AUQ4_9ENTE|nr:HAMP domain-containing sensor histidine kinase [Vagococcus hydrophili]QIL48798.1 HAMP domain-containing histidine kinase [Vagococcus hydrophili]